MAGRCIRFYFLLNGWRRRRLWRRIIWRRWSGPLSINNFDGLPGRAACRRLILKSELGGAGTAQLRKEALREPLLQPIMTVLRGSIVMLSHAGRRDIQTSTEIHHVDSHLVRVNAGYYRCSKSANWLAASSISSSTVTNFATSLNISAALAVYTVRTNPVRRVAIYDGYSPWPLYQLPTTYSPSTSSGAMALPFIALVRVAQLGQAATSIEYDCPHQKQSFSTVSISVLRFYFLLLSHAACRFDKLVSIN